MFDKSMKERIHSNENDKDIHSRISSDSIRNRYPQSEEMWSAALFQARIADAEREDALLYSDLD
jgi:hypothetical protein